MNSDTTGCKVDRIAAKYELHNLDDRLLRRRRHQNASLRDLDDYLAKQILKRAMEDAGMRLIDGHAEHYHQLLQSDDDITRREAREELRREGVPVEEVTDDFVSYQTVRKHLNDCLGVETGEDYTPEPAEDRRRLGDLKGRAEYVIERTLRRLRDHDAVDIGQPEAVVSFKVRCTRCSRTHTVSEFLRDRKCACVDEHDPESGKSISASNAPENMPN